MIIKALTWIKRSLGIWIIHGIISMILAALCVGYAQLFNDEPKTLFGIYTIIFLFVIQVATFLMKNDPRAVYQSAMTKFVEIEENIKFKGLNKEIKLMLRISADNTKEELLKKIMDMNFVRFNFFNPDNELERIQDYIQDLFEILDMKWSKKHIQQRYINIFKKDIEHKFNTIFMIKVKELLFSSDVKYASTRRKIIIDTLCNTIDEANYTFINKMETILAICGGCQNFKGQNIIQELEPCHLHKDDPCSNYIQKTS